MHMNQYGLLSNILGVKKVTEEARNLQQLTSDWEKFSAVFNLIFSKCTGGSYGDFIVLI